ncbi:hypothetical protein KDM41_18255, partial [bacterium]|nr:hypothetical protein [bacterium]
GGVALLEDLSERRQLEERMRESQKMEAIGRLAGGIAHDFNNLLSVVIGLADLLELEGELEARGREYVGDIQRVAQSGAELVAKLMTFSRRQVVRPELIDLVARVRESGSMLGRLIRETIAIELDTGDVGLWVELDRSQLDQILVNLCVNAADAMVGGGRLTIATSARDVGEGERTTLLEPGRYVCLSVRDTGAGIPEDLRSKIFEPFFTTKASGTGLGLANVYAIVTAAGGEVEVDSVVGEGTEFRVYLPMRVPPTRRRSRSGAAHQAVARGSERILLVEDNDNVRRSTSRQLEAIGYRVETARDGV